MNICFFLAFTYKGVKKSQAGEKAKKLNIRRFFSSNKSSLVSSWLVMIFFTIYTSITRFFITEHVDQEILGIFFTSYMFILAFAGIFLTIYRPYIYSKSSDFSKQIISRNIYIKSLIKPFLFTFLLLPIGIVIGEDIFLIIYGETFTSVKMFWNYLFVSLFLFILINLLGVCGRGLSYPSIELSGHLFFIFIFLLGFYVQDISSLGGFDFIIKIYLLESISFSLVLLVMATLFFRKISQTS